METENRHLAASLLVSILKRGYTKAYPHGIRFLKKLETCQNRFRLERI